MPRATAKRQLGHDAPLPTEGVEGFVRKYLPKDEHLVLFTFTAYATLIGLFKLTSGGGKPAEAAPTSTGGSSSAIPSVESDGFGDWLEKDGSIDRAIEALEKMQ